MKILKSLSVLALVMLMSSALFAQDDKGKRPSPPATAMGKVGNVDVKISYSQPAAKGREIFGALVPYDQVWRTGANEATTMEFSGDVMINGEAVSAGKYSLFTIPGEKSWTVILNKDANQWGAYKYNKEMDALRFMVEPSSTDKVSERFTIEVKEDGNVHLMWDKTAIAFQIEG